MVGKGQACFVVAEIGQNHNGDMDLARQLIDIAVSSGADAVKFQKRDISSDLTEEEYNRPYSTRNSFGETYGKHREALEFDEGQHAELKEYARSVGTTYFCTACDLPSVEIMENIGNPVYKVASRDLTNIPLIARIAETNKPIILSTGMSGLEEIGEALSVIPNYASRTILLQCVSEYPAQIKNMNLSAIQTLASRFNIMTGLSDHSEEFITGVAGAVLNAVLVEKHITLSRKMRGSDHMGALEENDLKEMVRYIRLCEEARGDGIKVPIPAAEAARLKLERSLVLAAPLSVGQVLQETHLSLKSPGGGLRWRDRERVLGRKALHNIPQDSTLREESFE